MQYVAYTPESGPMMIKREFFKVFSDILHDISVCHFLVKAKKKMLITHPALRVY